ncbi:MAG: response regulator, partial [Longimicrobiales bacterium]|nr:response regulator [Longimicrobiales bacterium]
RVLENADLTVVEAEGGRAALEALEKDSEITVMLTDLGLGDMNGFVLLDEVAERWPDLPVVVMSGYAEGSPGRRDGLPPDIPFVQKPFTPAGLLSAVRSLLGDPRDPRRMA